MLSAPQLLLITGPPASGKTQLAAALRTRYAAAACSKDELKEVLLDSLGTGDRAWSRRLSDASFALLFALGSRLLTRGGLLLLEGNFRAGEHEPTLRRLMSESQAQSAQVLCYATPATREARLVARAADPTRHPGHADARLWAMNGTADDFLDLPGPRLRFDSEHAWNHEFAALCRQLDLWVEGAADGA